MHSTDNCPVLMWWVTFSTEFNFTNSARKENNKIISLWIGKFCITVNTLHSQNYIPTKICRLKFHEKNYQQNESVYGSFLHCILLLLCLLRCSLGWCLWLSMVTRVPNWSFPWCKWHLLSNGSGLIGSSMIYSFFMWWLWLFIYMCQAHVINMLEGAKLKGYSVILHVTTSFYELNL